MLLNAFKRLALLSSVLSVLTAAGCASETQNPPSSSSNTGRCGDGAVDSDEECDDGNTAPGDGCNASCKKEAAAVCGNGSKEAGEECDDGNTTPGDGCDATCKSETGPLCGDGTQDPGEQCDDGNTAPGDGCDANCKKEVGPGCGNGLIDAGEECDDGNTKDGDGCESNCIHTPVPEVVCANLAPLPQGTCEVKPGNSGRLLIGTVLAPDKILRGGQVLVDGTGVIVHVGCDCTDAVDPAACTAASMSATTITCPEGVISPALLNSHDHITYAQNPPYTDTGERYEHRHDWRQGKNGHKKISSQSGASTDEVLWGELRFLLSGATSTVGSGSALGLLRNLDKTAQEGLGQKPVHFETFPLGDGSPGTQLAMGCGYPDIVTEAEIAADDAFFPHVAEGIDNFAENEFVCLSSSMNGGQDLVKPQSAFIHSIGLKATDYAAMAVDGTALIWSPRSNITLYGDTAVVTEAARLGVLVALGTDWMPTGSMNILRELRCADDFNTKRLGSYFTDRQLWQMVTSNAALASATDDVLGALAPGKVADITVFNGKTHKDFRAVIDAEAADVTLVLRGGKALYGDEAAIAGIGGSGVCDPIDVCGTTKALCLTGEIGKNFASLSTSVGAIYPAFFCGAPANEPSCTPMRPKSVDGSTVYDGSITATDKDGDNIDDMADNCPLVFNPVRPLDAGKQADFDGDGVGDACDVCPLDANTTQCTVFDPADSDGDGTPEIVDNCPGLANADQADGDSDGKGDVCDPCPTEPNPGPLACKATIYAVKNGMVAVNSKVAIEGVLVTARHKNGFYVQVKPGDPGYMGSDYSGAYVYDPANTVLVGDRVTLASATIQDFFGQIQLTAPTTIVLMSANEAPPDPVVVTTAQIATGGAKAAALEAVIVEVASVTVKNIAPPVGAGEMAPTNEYTVDDGSGEARVNDILYLTTPFPAVGDKFVKIRGILDHRNGNSKIEPRSAADLQGIPKLSGFGPALSFADVGQSGTATYPSPLTVTLSGPAIMDTFVAVTSGDMASLTVMGGGVTIPTGMTSATVLVSGVAAKPSVTLTATLDGSSMTANVRVLDGTELTLLTSLSPATAVIPPGGMGSFTVTLDVPAPAGGAVVSLSLVPANAGTIPATVTVPMGQISATFDYVDGNMAPSATITASLGGSMFSSTLTLKALAQSLVINEVDYDQIGTDSAEFIEIYNATGLPVDLAAYSIFLVQGADGTVYKQIGLGPAGTLADGQYLLLASAGVSVPVSALKIALTAAADNVQNGSPDAIALVNTMNNTLVDAISYEGSVTTAMLGALGTVNLVEGTPIPLAVADSNTVNGSLCRVPNGSDTNDAKTDWVFSSTPTPGAANVP